MLKIVTLGINLGVQRSWLLLKIETDVNYDFTTRVHQWKSVEKRVVSVIEYVFHPIVFFNDSTSVLMWGIIKFVEIDRCEWWNQSWLFDESNAKVRLAVKD